MKITDFNNTALIYENKKISYSELIENIGSFYSYIDIQANEKVAIFCENRPEWIYILFASWQKEGICIPIDSQSNEEEVIHILEDSTPKLIFVSKNNQKTANKAINRSKHKAKIINIDNIKLSKKEFFQKSMEPGKYALILYTSGTTGKPKGVVLSFSNLYSNINSIKKTNIVTPKDSVIALLPFHHSYPLMTTILAPLQLGSTICIVKEISSDIILKNLQEHKISIFIGVPRLFDLLHKSIIQKISSSIIAKTVFNIAKFVNSKLISKVIFSKLHKKFGGNIKYFVSGGAKLDPEVANDFKTLGFTIIEGYGLTETSPIISFNPPNKIKIGSCGKVIDNVEAKIIDGEIAVKGDNVMIKYYNLEEKTKEAVKDGWFFTGDLGRLDDEGYIFITGRKKEMLVLPSGKNINPEEIENKMLKTSKYIKEAGVILKEGNLFAFIYPNFEELKDILNINETIKWKVVDAYNLKAASYKKITGFKIVNKELPKTRLGKIKHFKLQSLLSEEKKVTASGEPKSEIYKTLKEYLKNSSNKEVLPEDNIEIDLGLDSLAKIELLTFIDMTFGIKIDELTLSKNLMVRKLYELIEKQNIKISSSKIDWSKILLEKADLQLSKNHLVINLFRIFLKTLFKLYFRLEINQPHSFPNKPFIIAPNHQSLLDGPLVMSSLPKEVLNDTYIVMDETFFKSKMLRAYVDNKPLHIIAINKDINLKRSLQKSAAILKNGKNIVIFPEGARSRDENPIEFKKLFAILARELQVPIVPAVIDGAFDAFPITSRFPKPKKIKVSFLEHIEPEGSYEQITLKTKDMIIKKLKENRK